MADIHGLLIVDKPRGVTSHDVVARIRRLLKTRRVGHAGTLDPAAEGVLVIAVGRATKLLTYLADSPKRYLAHVVLGVESISGDIEGPAAIVAQMSLPSRDDVDRVVARFRGEQSQIPPAHSAVKVHGQPLYRLARQGVDVDVPSRTITIHSLSVIEFGFPDLLLDIECSAGTYIRSLARDIGGELAIGGYLHYLLRASSGSFELSDAWPMEQLEQELSPGTFASFAQHPAVIPIDSRALLLDSDGVRSWYDGRPVAANIADRNRATAHAFRPDGSWLGAGQFVPTESVYQPRIVVHD
ncbi:MAG: tRNA pseudouridine(55) synthase TruB [Nitrolancea sp.]